MLSMIPLPYKLGAGALAASIAILAFNLWLNDVKREAFREGREDAIAELAIETEKLKAEYEREAAVLRAQLQERNRQYALDVQDITRRTLAAASVDNACLSSDTVRLLNARTARTNADIEEAAGGFNVPLSADPGTDR